MSNVRWSRQGCRISTLVVRDNLGREIEHVTLEVPKQNVRALRASDELGLGSVVPEGGLSLERR